MMALTKLSLFVKPNLGKFLLIQVASITANRINGINECFNLQIEIQST
jgi:hypothetical protein